MKHKWSILAVMLCMIFTSCAPSTAGSSDKEYSSSSPVLSWEDAVVVPTYVSPDFESEEGMVLDEWYPTGEELVLRFIVDNCEIKYASVNILSEDWEPVWKKFEFPKTHSSIRDIAQDKEGNYYVLENDQESSFVVDKENGISQSGICLGKYDREGKLIFRTDITEDLIMNQCTISAINNVLVDQSGRIVISGVYDFIILMDHGKYGGYIRESDVIQDCVVGRDGSIYYNTINNMLKRVNTEEIRSELIIQEYVSGGLCSAENVVSEGNTEPVYGYSNTTVYRYDNQEKSVRELFMWTDTDVDVYQIKEMTELSDGRILLVCDNEFTESDQNELELIYLTRMAEAPADQRQVITVGTVIAYDDLRKAILKFNRYHTEYKVKLKEYADNYSMSRREEGMSELDLDLVTGNLPDILYLENIDLHKYISKGLLADLNPFLEKSQQLKREDLVDEAVDAYTFDGKLVGIPKNFRLKLIAAPTDLLTGKDPLEDIQIEDNMVDTLSEMSGWTLNEMYAYIEKNADDAVWKSTSPEQMLDFCLQFQQQEWIDWSKGTCSFDSEVFKEMLQFSNQFKGENTNLEFDKLVNEKGKKLLYSVWFTGPHRITEIPQFFDGKAVTYIGYPVTDGTTGIIMDAELSAYGIMEDSPHKEAAWSFLESMICSEEGEEKLFSVRRDVVEQIIDTSSEEPYIKKDEDSEVWVRRQEKESVYRRKDGTSYYIYAYALLPENAELLRQLIDNARPVTGNHQAIDRIIQEEASAYFAGQKPVEEVMRLIQNRVELYVSENKRRAE